MPKPKSKSKGTKKSRAVKQQPSRSSSRSTSPDDVQFRTTLQSQGLTIQEMSRDGNCLFRSLSDQLYRDQGAQHGLVRDEVCNHLSQNRETFECFLLLYDEDEDVVDFDEYVCKMREDGEWGGNVELVAASRVYRRDVRIYSGLYDGGVMLIQYPQQEENADDEKQYGKRGNKKKKNDTYNYQEYEEQQGIVHFGDLLLSYHDNDHYNSVHSTHADKSKLETHEKAKGAATSVGTPSSAMALPIKSNSKPRKGADCPCGSGVKYKKCCAVKDKSAARVAKLREKNGGEEKKDDLDDGFKMLTI